MKLKRPILFSVRLPEQLVQEIENIMKNYGATNVSEFVRQACQLTIQIESYKSIMTDPRKREEFFAKLNHMLKSEKIFDWVATLEDSQMNGIKMAIDMEKENRFKQGKLR